MTSRPPFDAVLFDLDGTLVATERFWVSAGRTGARRALEELGLARAVPPAETWLAMIGHPLEQAFARAFPDLETGARAHVMARCLEEEAAALRAGRAALMPGARACLEHLAAGGARLGIASNCSRGYLETMLSELRLSELVEAAYCLDTPGVGSKSDMVAALLERFGTRSAVMVGDRLTDAEAARANGVPYVQLRQGYAPAGEEVESQGEIGDLGELPALLERRRVWIEDALRSLGVLRASLPAAASALRALGITGRPAAGKSLFARDAAALLAARGRATALVALDEFLVPARSEALPGPEEDHLAQGFDVERLVGRVLGPHARGEVVAEGACASSPIAPGALIVLEGPFLLHPRLRIHLDRLLYLDVDEETTLAREGARARRGAETEAVLRLRRRQLPAHQAFERRFDPRARADLVLAAANPLGAPGGPEGKGAGASD